MDLPAGSRHQADFSWAHARYPRGLAAPIPLVDYHSEPQLGTRVCLKDGPDIRTPTAQIPLGVPDLEETLNPEPLEQPNHLNAVREPERDRTRAPTTKGSSSRPKHVLSSNVGYRDSAGYMHHPLQGP